MIAEINIFPPASMLGPTIVWFLALMMAVASCQQQLQPTGLLAATAATTNNSSPYWRRPGCYQVGHTRTISIPGCVKFNLTTNACRGYCMSYSIPASEDLVGPGQTQHEVILNFQAPDLQLSDAAATMATKATPTDLEERKARFVGEDFGHRFEQLIRNHQQQQQHTNVAQQFGSSHQVDQQISNGERRDVVSVSQCCSMMETEDVVVNLRCGANEIRRLIFKSAKTCECFFCKHV